MSFSESVVLTIIKFSLTEMSLKICLIKKKKGQYRTNTEIRKIISYIIDINHNNSFLEYLSYKDKITKNLLDKSKIMFNYKKNYIIVLLFYYLYLTNKTLISLIFHSSINPLNK